MAPKRAVFEARIVTLDALDATFVSVEVAGRTALVAP
jgi:hypothetical protein